LPDFPTAYVESQNSVLLLYRQRWFRGVFVGNQLNTDIAGGREYGIRTVWLSGCAYRSADETLSVHNIRPTHRIHTLGQIPSLLESLYKAK
jgi:ribonucleotide monophosphatase NagD (HAD superfamily)